MILSAECNPLSLVADQAPTTGVSYHRAEPHHRLPKYPEVPQLDAFIFVGNATLACCCNRRCGTFATIQP